MSKKLWALMVLSSGFVMALGLNCIPNIGNSFLNLTGTGG